MISIAVFFDKEFTIATSANLRSLKMKSQAIIILTIPHRLQPVGVEVDLNVALDHLNSPPVLQTVGGLV